MSPVDPMPPGATPGPSAGAGRPLAGRSPGATGARRGLAVAVAVGLAVGLLLVVLSLRMDRFAGLPGDAAIAIRVNGLDERIGRDLWLPTAGWVLEIELPEGLPEGLDETLRVELREERTGTTIEIVDQLERRGRRAFFVVPESLGLIEGLFSVRASLRDEADRELATHHRLRIRTWLGGPPIGSRQVIAFDFSVDRDEDGRADFEQDLVRLGLVAPDAPGIAAAAAERLAARALDRVRAAYDPTDDPNDTGLERDPVRVRFVRNAERSPFVTRICVGGQNLAHPGSVGNVRYDPHNKVKGAPECGPRDGDPAAGLFPSELAIYRDDPLWRELLDPFDPERGGVPLGAREGDAARIESPGPGDGVDRDARAEAIDLAIDVLGHALGTVMAHEAAHALGLVPPGRPAVGLLGGDAGSGDGYAHNDRRGLPAAPRDAAGGDEVGNGGPWLMDAGPGVRFADLAGRGEAGPLRFRPLNHAYLRDRVVLRKRGAR